LLVEPLESRMMLTALPFSVAMLNEPSGSALPPDPVIQFSPQQVVSAATAATPIQWQGQFNEQLQEAPPKGSTGPTSNWLVNVTYDLNGQPGAVPVGTGSGSSSPSYAFDISGVARETWRPATVDGSGNYTAIASAQVWLCWDAISSTVVVSPGPQANPLANNFTFTTDTAIKQSMTPLAATAASTAAMPAWIADTTNDATGTIAGSMASGSLSVTEKIQQTLSQCNGAAAAWVTGWTITAEFDGGGTFQPPPVAEPAFLSATNLSLTGTLSGTFSPPPLANTPTKPIDDQVTANVETTALLIPVTPVDAPGQSMTSLEAPGTQVVVGSGGQLTVQSPVVLDSDGSVSAVDGGVLVVPGINSATDAAGLELDGGTLQASGSFSTTAPVTLAAGGGTFDANGNNLTLGGALAGPGGVTTIDSGGGGTVTLCGVNTYTGPTVAQSGTLVVLGAQAVPAGGALSVGATGSVVLGAPGASEMQSLGQPTGGSVQQSVAAAVAAARLQVPASPSAAVATVTAAPPLAAAPAAAAVSTSLPESESLPHVAASVAAAGIAGASAASSHSATRGTNEAWSRAAPALAVLECRWGPRSGASTTDGTAQRNENLALDGNSSSPADLLAAACWAVPARAHDAALTALLGDE
jgi:autotransporter-associated beta strand protein